MKLKATMDGNGVLNRFTNFICSTFSEGVAFDIIENGIVVGYLQIRLSDDACQITQLCFDCDKNSDLLLRSLVAELEYEYPDVISIWFFKDDACNNFFGTDLFEKKENKWEHRIPRIAVTALKPSDGGLHFGHYFGNIQPLLERQERYKCYFIFADLQLLNTDKKYYNVENRMANIRFMLRQLLALGVNPQKTTIILESQLKSQAMTDFITLSDFSTDARNYRIPYIKSVKWGETEAQDEGKSLPVKMSVLNYPIMEALDFYLTNADIMFSNMDNKACVEFTNELYQKMFAAHLMPRKKIKLIHGLYDYLPGIDGKKMSKGNGNAIFFTDTDECIQRKVNKMYTDPNRISANIPGAVDNNVVFKFLRLFLDGNQYNDIERMYLRGEIGDVKTKQILSAAICQFLLQFRQAKKAISEQDINQILGVR